MENVDLISRRILLERIEKERAYLKARGLYGAEEVLTKYLHNIVEDMPPGEIELPVIKINIPKEDIQKLLEELQKPQKVLVLPEPEVEFVRPQGEWIGGKQCSVCGNFSSDNGKFCTNCGASMRGKVK